MEKITVPTTKGMQEEIVYNIKDFPYTKQLGTTTYRKGNKAFINVPCAFDIETTTIDCAEPYGFMYQWQFCVGEDVCFGRTWEEFQTFVQKLTLALQLNKNRLLPVYVHNLAFEFQFMYQFIQIDSIFAKDKRKPLKVTTPGIEYRCSYFLSNMSLKKFCENSHLCTHYKMDGEEFDYRKRRTPATELTMEEKGYCYNDVRGLCECIASYMEHDTLDSIPLTNTGFVRRDYRNKMQSQHNRKIFEKIALTPPQYELLRAAFRGGNTHANRFMANRILSGVYSYDEQSSYPAEIMTGYYPMGKFMWVTLDTQEKLDKYCAEFCVVMEITIYNPSAKEGVVIPYIPISKCTEHANIVNDNGRVLSADLLTMSLTEIDLEIIRKTYDMDGFTVNKAMYARRGELPRELRETMMEYYKAKTTLKGVEGKEYEYMKSKNRLNSSFGMMVSDIAHGEIGFADGEWKEQKPDLAKAIDKYYKSRNNFMSYQWGVYVTAHARASLQEMIDEVGEDAAYVDTDSVKFVGEEHCSAFENRNAAIESKCSDASIPALCEHKGKKYYLGTWDYDGYYKKFKTLGAKKYAYVDSKDNFHITVSGMGKAKGAKAVGCIENFKLNAKPFEDVGRTVSYYNDTPVQKITVDACSFTTGANIGVLDTTYTLGVTYEYWNLIYENEELHNTP